MNTIAILLWKHIIYIAINMASWAIVILTTKTERNKEAQVCNSSTELEPELAETSKTFIHWWASKRRRICRNQSRISQLWSWCRWAFDRCTLNEMIVAPFLLEQLGEMMLAVEDPFKGCIIGRRNRAASMGALKQDLWYACPSTITWQSQKARGTKGYTGLWMLTVRSEVSHWSSLWFCQPTRLDTYQQFSVASSELAREIIS